MDIHEILARDPFHRTIDQATKIYHGLCNCCRCGCGGRYFDNGTIGFKRAICKMSKPEFKPLIKGDLVWVNSHACAEMSEGVVYDTNYIDIPYNQDNDKCYCIYFD